jgi:hypothetical protein
MFVLSDASPFFEFSYIAAPRAFWSSATEQAENNQGKEIVKGADG